MALAWSEGTWGTNAWDVGGLAAIVDVSGTSASGAIGSTTNTAFANIQVTGVSAAGDVGEETALGNTVWGGGAWDGFIGWGGKLNAAPDITGLSAAGEVGTLSATGVAQFNVTGVVGTFADPFVYAGISVSVNTTGVSSSGAIGAASVQAKASASPTGVEGSGAIGTVIAAEFKQVYVTGVVGTGELGEENAPDYQSWGGSYWGGPLGWGGRLNADASVTGVEAVGEIGVDHVQIGGAIVRPTGVSADTELGEEDVLGKANVQVTGVSSSGLLGTVSTSAKAVVDVTGVVGTITAGTLTTRTDNNFRVTGVVANTALGEVDMSGYAFVTVTGVSATGRISTPLVWGLIDTNQTPNWLPIAA